MTTSRSNRTDLQTKDDSVSVDISPSFASFLDLARALSAIAVFIDHLRYPLFVRYPDLPIAARSPILRAWYFLTGFGFAAVVVFFVLSGFLVGGVGLSRVRRRCFRPSDYFVDRFSRLFVVLIPALLLTLVLDKVGLHYLNWTGFWDGTNPVLQKRWVWSFVPFGGSSSFACNLAMLQSFYCQVYSSDTPLWSLSYEFWFYMCFGAAAVAAGSGNKGRIIAVACAAAIIALLGRNFIWLGIVWLFGAAAHAYAGKWLRRPWLASLGFVATLLVIRVIDAGPPPGRTVNNLAILAEGAAFAWVLVSMRGVRSSTLLRLRSLGSRLAGFSYTLYLIHFPLMLFVVAAIATIFRIDGLVHGFLPFSPLGLAFYGAVFLIVMIFAWLFSRITEAHTHRVRAWGRRRLADAFARQPEVSRLGNSTE